MLAPNQGSAQKPSPSLLPTVWFACKLCLLFISFEWAYFLIPDHVLRDVIYHRGLVNPCAAFITLLNANELVTAQQNFLLAPAARLEIVRGCDGAGVIFLLAAAMLAFTCSSRAKFWGLLIGIVFMLLVNYGRIVGLYFIAAYKSQWFALVHSYLAPTFIILLGCLVFAVWARAAAGQAND